ncbi:probable protein phosphatase 2c 63 [Phtheirospermum japonicum]|uniref:protein-serine/threonine phosphatase n=1 Tax=Phtheirospermum japonicum TaxID=374723 RepID=A0A830BP53_9LAMI|nr:probable protein phosphatase 2c 63 [Phtheirospermum japonicum]
MLRSCCYRCFGRRNGDGLLWHVDLKPHTTGEFSIAVVQANSSLEDQSQVFTSPSATYVGVYDGHGGPEASRFVNRHLFPYLHKFSTEHGGLSAEVIKKAFSATEQDFTHLVKRSLPVKPQIASVGSCCLVGAISDGQLYVANLGDSRAVLGRRGFDGEKKLVAERLSTDHNVSCEDVRREVEALHPDDNPVVVYCRGVWRIKGIIQAYLLSYSFEFEVSRSIGDIYLKKPEFHRDPIFLQYANYVPMKRPVLSAEPSIVTRKLKPQDLFIIFASDGLWEHISDEAAVQIVSKHPRAGIAKRLVAAAIQEAAKKRELRYKDIKKIERGIRRHFHDDITVIVMYLDDHKTSSKSNHKQSTAGCFTPPVDIYSYNSDEVVENSGDKIFPNEEESRLRVAY